MVHDADPVAQRGGLIHVVGREQDGHAVVAKLADAVPDKQARGGVEACRRLVEEEHLRLVHERPRDHHPLHLTTGEEIDLLVPALREAELSEELVGPRVALARRHAVISGVEQQVLTKRQRPVEVVALGDDREPAAGGDWVRDDVDAGDERAARGAPRSRREDADRRRLACAIRAEQAEDLAARDREADRIDRGRGAPRVALHEVDDSNGGSIGPGCERLGHGATVASGGRDGPERSVTGAGRHDLEEDADVQAIIVNRRGGPEVLEATECDDPVAGDGELLVDVAAIGVNFRDIYEREGQPPYVTEPPFVPGTEGAGTVASLGPGVARFKVGDRVAWTLAPRSYAERVVVNERDAVAVPDGVGLETAAAAMLQGLTAHYLCGSTYAVAPGERVVVHAAAGGVGLLLTQMVRRRGGLVLATTSTPEKAALATAAGAEIVADYADFAAVGRQWSDGVGVAAVYDGIGRDTFDASLEVLGPRGCMVLYGSASGVLEPVDLLRLAPKSLFLTRPVLRDYLATREEFESRSADLFGWIGSGELDVRIGATFPLSHAFAAHEALRARRTTGKVLLVPGG